jgi:hypothetical protein
MINQDSASSSSTPFDPTDIRFKNYNHEPYEEDLSSNSSDSTSPPNSSISTGESLSSGSDSDFGDQKLVLIGQDAAKQTGGRRRNRKNSTVLFCSRETSLGEMRKFTDKMLLMVASYLMPKDLVRLGYVSWMFLAVAHDEKTWRTLVLNLCVDRKTKIGTFCYHGTWRRTMLHPSRFPNRNYNDQDVAPLTHVNDEFATSAIPNKYNRTTGNRYWMIDSPSKPRYARIRKTETEKRYNVNGRNPSYEPAKDTMYLGAVDRRSNLSYLEFVEQYERPNRPVIITDIAKDWPASFKWQQQNFVEHYGETLFNINCRSTKGYRFRMKIFDFFAYCEHCNCEKFMYVFDKFIFKRDRKQRIVNDFKVPVYFQQDLFDLMDEYDRPDYRWMLGTAFFTERSESRSTRLTSARREPTKIFSTATPILQTRTCIGTNSVFPKPFKNNQI